MTYHLDVLRLAVSLLQPLAQAIHDIGNNYIIIIINIISIILINIRLRIVCVPVCQS